MGVATDAQTASGPPPFAFETEALLAGVISFCTNRFGLFRGIHKCRLTPIRFAVTFNEWQDSLRVESVITKSTHFVALPEYPRNSPHRAAWVSFLTRELCAYGP